MGTALHALLQMWDELVSGLEQIQTSPEGLDVVFASRPSHKTVLEGSWRRPFAVLSFLPQCPLSQKACSRARVGSAPGPVTAVGVLHYLICGLF